MQAYRPPVQPYFPQGQFPQAQPAYYQQYPPYPGFMPNVGGQALPFGGVYPAEQYDMPRQAFPAAPPPSRSRPLGRSQSAVVPPKRAPMKSIMKKKHDRTTSMGGEPMSRTRTNSTSRARAESRQESRANSRANSSTRSRADSNPYFTPDHLFLALHGSNEIRMENVVHLPLVEDFREVILPMWPHGVTAEEYRRQLWRTQFSGNPWASSGVESIIARRMVCRLFSVLAGQGYNYLSTINTSNQPARLVFSDSPPDSTSHFFSMTLSNSGDKLAILDAPPDIAQSLGMNLRGVFPRKIASDQATEEGMYVIALKRGAGVDRSLFAAFVLQFFASVGYRLNGSFPFGRSGPLSFGSRKELWIFRGPPRRPESANGHRRRRPSRGPDPDVRNQAQQ